MRANESENKNDMPLVKTLVQTLSRHVLADADNELADWLERGYGVADITITDALVRVVTLIRDAGDYGVDAPVPYELVALVPDEDDNPTPSPSPSLEGDDEDDNPTPKDTVASAALINPTPSPSPSLEGDESKPTGIPKVLEGIIDDLPIAKSIATKGLAATKAAMDADIMNKAEAAFVERMSRHSFEFEPLQANNLPNVITISL